MPASSSTCWTLIEGAAKGNATDRESFAVRYGPAVRAYLDARWQGSPLLADAEDALQEVFLECFRDGGVLGRVLADRPHRFRGFLHGVSRNVASRWEERRAKRRPEPLACPEELAGDHDCGNPDRAYDRAWARTIMLIATERLEDMARNGSPALRRRVDLLRLRFSEGLPIRAIAARWGISPRRAHKDYTYAREAFREKLLEVVAWHMPGEDIAKVEEECRLLLSLLP
jgi:RNA polymerase sigma-70 factor (ECF subfamily)